jgi:hypothetical protein
MPAKRLCVFKFSLFRPALDFSRASGIMAVMPPGAIASRRTTGPLWQGSPGGMEPLIIQSLVKIDPGGGANGK